ncbi:CHAD domain-containing protein [Synechocystis sp. FACHB-383]|uniref:CHAD domain-containing protein n=1 Tax=Synechocystis sp. FACHB-383 TaxID=2692864 RepID=UPI0016860C65|nr:CHAD domain-containing protein [Synechocystis sp. FACHB-383]MBD2654886.1 CHAD domain-containing protein [Synechocystis sp. FACHB-383]
METAARTFGKLAIFAFSKHTEKVFKYAPRVLKDQDPEDLHQLRVGVRRLRTAIAGFEAAVQLPKGLTEERVGKIGKRLGAQRDNDVLQEILLSKYLPHLPKNEQRYLNKVLKYLQKERKHAFKATYKLLTHDKFSRFKQHWQGWLDQPQITVLGSLAIADVLPDLLLPQLAEFFLHPGWLVGTEIVPDPHGTAQQRRCIQLSPSAIEILLDGEELVLHDLRKQAKRTRYQMELFSDYYGQEYQELLAKVKMTQEILGSLQDSFVLRAMVEQYLDVDLKKLCPQWNAIFHGDRLGYWDQWQPIQNQFIDPGHRQQCRQLVQNPTGNSNGKMARGGFEPPTLGL